MLGTITRALLLSTCVYTQAFPKSFNGLYFGGQGAWVQREDSVQSPPSKTKQSNGSYKVGPIDTARKNSYAGYGFLMGIGHRLPNNVYIGTEVSVETHNIMADVVYKYPYVSVKPVSSSYGSTSSAASSGGTPPSPSSAGTPPLFSPGGSTTAAHTFPPPPPAGGDPAPVPIQAKAKMLTKYERGCVLSLVYRTGVILENETLVYAKLALEQSRDRVKTTYVVEYPNQTVVQQNSHMKNQLVFVMGGGVEKSYGPFHMRCEYNYNPGASIKRESAVSGKPLSETHGYKAHILKGAVIYHL